MTRRRRAALLLGLALVLGVLAASDVARREARLREQLGPDVGVVVAREELARERELRSGDLALRRVPERYVPPDAVLVPDELIGRRLAAPVARHGFVTRSSLALDELAAGAPVRPGERAAEVIALGSPEVVVAGSRVDVLVTRERDEAGAGGAELALQDVEVLAAAPAGSVAAAEGDDGAPRVAATLRVTVRQAVYLAAAAAFARDVRLLARAAGDRRRSAPIAIGTTLR